MLPLSLSQTIAGRPLDFSMPSPQLQPSTRVVVAPGIRNEIRLASAAGSCARSSSETPASVLIENSPTPALALNDIAFGAVAVAATVRQPFGATHATRPSAAAAALHSVGGRWPAASG